MQCTRIILKPFSTHPGSAKKLSFMKPVPDAKKAENGWDNSRLEDWRSYFKFNSSALPSSHVGAHKLTKKNRKKKKEDGRSPIHLTFSSHICRLFPLRQGHMTAQKRQDLWYSVGPETPFKHSRCCHTYWVLLAILDLLQPRWMEISTS